MNASILNELKSEGLLWIVKSRTVALILSTHAIARVIFIHLTSLTKSSRCMRLKQNRKKEEKGEKMVGGKGPVYWAPPYQNRRLQKLLVVC
jgi:hypothetical protein